jgi:hypothetical protein
MFMSDTQSQPTTLQPVSDPSTDRAVDNSGSRGKQIAGRFKPGVSGNVSGPSNYVTNGDITVNVTPPPGADAKQTGQLVGSEVRNAIKREYRDAASGLQRGNSK